jgi:hypothetical protein
LVAVAVLAGAAATGGALLHANDEPDPGVPWDSYRLTSQGVEVYRLLRSCDRVTDVDVEETSQQVRITLHVARDTGCGDVATPTASQVELADALGSREVVDGACLDQEFASSLCERGLRQPVTPR